MWARFSSQRVLKSFGIFREMRAEHRDGSARTARQEMIGFGLERKDARIGVVRGQAVLLLAQAEKGHAFAQPQFGASALVQLPAVLGDEAFHRGERVERRIGPGRVDLLNAQAWNCSRNFSLMRPTLLNCSCSASTARSLIKAAAEVSMLS